MIFNQGTLIAIFGFCITIWLSSNALAVIIKGLNKAYAIEETRSFVFTRVLAIMMVLINSLLLFLAVNLIVLGKVFLDFMMQYTILSQLSIDLISILRWPVAYFALAVCAMSNYFILPCIEGNDKIKFRSVLPGTLFFCLFCSLFFWHGTGYLGRNY